jgi:hypothetical protein
MRKVLKYDLLTAKTSNQAAVVVTIIAMEFYNRNMKDVVKVLGKTDSTIRKLYR